jgi:hypothetical protein
MCSPGGRELRSVAAAMPGHLNRGADPLLTRAWVARVALWTDPDAAKLSTARRLTAGKLCS